MPLVPSNMDESRTFELDPNVKQPAYAQIRDYYRDRIGAGDLSGGHRLPPERELAATLGVSRTTVVRAYDELRAEGWVERHVGRGTTVAQRQEALDVQPVAWPACFSGIARRIPRHAEASERLSALLRGRPVDVSLAHGLPDPTLISTERLSEAWNAVIGRLGTAVVGSCPVQGIPEVRDLVSERSRARELSVRPEDVTIVNGSQHGLDLLLRLLVEPGDTVLVEVPTYFVALQCFLSRGLRILGVPTDGRGMDVGRVELLLSRYRPRLIYTVPTYQNPTGSTLSLERRERLLALAQKYQVPIVEDDPFGDLHFDEPPPPPIKALDRHGHVLYLSTFSKSLAPGLRVGWLVAPDPVADRASRLNGMAELHPNTAGQHLVVEFARRGWLDELIERARATYAGRSAAMHAALQKARVPDLRWTPPGGGLFQWLELPEGLDAYRLLERTLEQGVSFVPGALMYPAAGRRNVCRLNFSVPDASAIERGIATIASEAKRMLRRPLDEPEAETVSGPIV